MLFEVLCEVQCVCHEFIRRKFSDTPRQIKTYTCSMIEMNAKCNGPKDGALWYLMLSLHIMLYLVRQRLTGKTLKSFCQRVASLFLSRKDVHFLQDLSQESKCRIWPQII